MATLWDEMQQEGGMTGYCDLFKTSEDRLMRLNANWIRLTEKSVGLFDWLSDYNQTPKATRAMRLSVYKVVIDDGLSRQRAASMATV
jgi:hypothetical protein